MPTIAYKNISQARLEPVMFVDDAREMGVGFAANLVIPKGTILGLVSATAASEVQTITIGGTPTGGVLGRPVFGNALKFTGNTSLAYDITAANMRAALEALPNIGVGNVAVSLNSNVYTVTFQGALANQPQPFIEFLGTALTGGSNPSVTVARTTAGVAKDKAIPYDGSVWTPTLAPTVAGNGSGSSFGAGTYSVQYTYVTAGGESTPSPATQVTATAAQNLRVSALTGLDASITSVRYYVNGAFAIATNTSSGSAAQTDIVGTAPAAGGVPPTINRATKFSDGRQIAKLIAPFDFATDPSGDITLGLVPSGGEHGKTFPVQSVWYRGGVWNTADLIGLDANAVASLGRLLAGTTSSGQLLFT